MKSWASACWARSRSVFGQVGAAEQVLVHAHRALELAAAPKQVAEREMQVGGVGVLLDGLDEGVDRLVVLLVEQQVQALVVGLGRILLLAPATGAGRSREASQPSAKASGRPSSSHCRSKSIARRVRRGSFRCRSAAAGRSARASIDRRAALRGDAAMPPPARHHREDAEGTAERERGEHDEDHRRAPLLAEEPADAGLLLVVQREGEQGEEYGGPEEPDEQAHRAVTARIPAPRRPIWRHRAARARAPAGRLSRVVARLPGRVGATGTCASTASRKALPGLKCGTSFSGDDHLLAASADCGRRAAGAG